MTQYNIYIYTTLNAIVVNVIVVVHSLKKCNQVVSMHDVFDPQAFVSVHGVFQVSSVSNV